MTSGLSMGSSSLDKGAPEITPQQERTLDVEQNRANLSNIEQKVDTQLASNDIFAQYPADTKGIVKNARKL